HYAGYAAPTVGGSVRITQNPIIKMGVSATSGGNHVLVNAGLGRSW
ncbi:MAG TPA: YadA-like family protein, partial [Paraburkholderia sp.]|nr:YadA-like family protein [Paraburkholderia sp.]